MTYNASSGMLAYHSICCQTMSLHPSWSAVMTLFTVCAVYMSEVAVLYVVGRDLL